MASYAPPSETLPIFNPSVFLTNDAGDFLAFPVAQGSETFPFGLTASSLTTVAPTTIDSLVMSDLNPQYKINYPVNSGRIDFFSNTAVGVSTRGGKIDATGVHTISKFDTIDETTGTLDIGTLAARTGTINIGTGGSASKTITIGSLSMGTTSINGGGVFINPATVELGNNQGAANITIGRNITSGSVGIATLSTGGTITIGQDGATASTTTIAIGSGSNQTGAINIGTGGSASKTITIGSLSMGTTSINGGGVFIQPATSLELGNNVAGIDISIGRNITAAGVINIGHLSTAGGITIGQSGATASTTTIAIGNGSNQTGAINIGTGTATAKAITIGNVSGAFGTLDLGTASISIANASNTTALKLGTGMTSGAMHFGRNDSTSTTTTVGIAVGNGQTGAISIGNGTGTKTITIGNATGTTVALEGSTITASKMAVAGTLSAAASTLTSVASNTYTGTTMTITPVTSLAIGGTTAANSPFFNNVGGTTSINGGNATQSIEIGHGQTTGVINIGNITTRTGAITLGFSGQTTSLTTNATTINLGDTSTTGGIIVGVPFRPNWNAQTYSYTSAEMGYQTTQTPATVAIAGATVTNLTGTFTLGNGVWMIVLRVLVNSSATTAAAWFRVGLSKTSGTFEDDRITDFAPTTTVGNNYLVTTYIVQSSASQTWYVLGAQAGVTTTIPNTNIRVQQTRIS